MMIDILKSMGFDGFKIIGELSTPEEFRNNFLIKTGVDESGTSKFEPYTGDFDFEAFLQKLSEYETVRKWFEIRAKRNRLLAETDWTQLQDAPCNQGQYAVYRQKLRDIPHDFSDPDQIIWPSLIS